MHSHTCTSTHTHAPTQAHTHTQARACTEIRNQNASTLGGQLMSLRELQAASLIIENADRKVGTTLPVEAYIARVNDHRERSTSTTTVCGALRGL